MSITVPDAGTRARQNEAAGTGTPQESRRTPDVYELAGRSGPDASTAPRSREPDNSLVGQQQRVDRVGLLKRLRAERVVFRKLELREGVVLAVDEDWFRVRLVDPEDAQPDEEVDVLIEQVSPADQRLIAPGALFFWAVGYVTRRGTRELVCKVTFRRRPRATWRHRQEFRALAAAALDDLT